VTIEAGRRRTTDHSGPPFARVAGAGHLEVDAPRMKEASIEKSRSLGKESQKARGFG